MTERQTFAVGETIRQRHLDAVDAMSDEIASLRARVEVLETAGRYIKPYLVWTVGPESPGHHPTMPSAVGAYLDTLARQALKDTP